MLPSHLSWQQKSVGPAVALASLPRYGFCVVLREQAHERAVPRRACHSLFSVSLQLGADQNSVVFRKQALSELFELVKCAASIAQDFAVFWHAT